MLPMTVAMYAKCNMWPETLTPPYYTRVWTLKRCLCASNPSRYPKWTASLQLMQNPEIRRDIRHPLSESAVCCKQIPVETGPTILQLHSCIKGLYCFMIINNRFSIILQIYTVLPAFPGFLVSLTSPASQIALKRKNPRLVLMAPT